MDPEILAFAQVVAIIVPSIAVLTAIGIFAHRFVERTNRLPHRPAQPLDDNRLQRLEQAVDAIATEVERLGEGQRFVTKILVERQHELPAPDTTPRAARPITPH